MRDVLQKVAFKLAQLGASSPSDVNELFAELRAAFDKELGHTSDLGGLEQLRARWRGRKGLDRNIRQNWLSPESSVRFAVGKAYNDFKEHVESALAEKRIELEAEVQKRVEAEHLDVTLPGLAQRRGARHLITQTMEEICGIFERIGFSVVEGPEVETDYYNFEALNIPEHHPARDTMDTFYLDLPVSALPAEVRGRRPGTSPFPLLRTHTSPVQIRTMEKQPPPVRVVVPGKVYRRDNPDATHSFMFHQIEGLAVDRDITFCEFKGTMEYFLREFFGPKTRTRFSASYFPFTEPSADLAATCSVCEGAGCRVCKQTGWIELFGAGMVNPAVYGFVGYEPGELSGFAFGMGVERFAMVKYGVDDLQLFFQNDVRFLQQFRR
ncbi:MAG: phenylalanine--tRNA ligase subunit alpha [Acidobacteria bacterium]|nr:phenylalanine--tRNA ligase subunit alpha [Acidobacteriota bacterium]